MKCTICLNEKHNMSFVLREMMYGFMDEFEYVQCSVCKCIQIFRIPESMGKYYPSDYYSYNTNEKPLKIDLFRSYQCQSIIGANNSFLGKLITRNYKYPSYYNYLKELKLYNRKARVLDIGSGTGELLKDFYKIGYKDLTGIDPYIKNEIIYNKNFRILKKSLFDLTDNYDCIMLHHSLEHMDKQHAVMKKLYDLLSKDGTMLIRIPVFSQPLMDLYGTNVVSLDPPRHFFIHSMKSISLLLDQNGFKIDKVIFDAHEFSFWASEQYQKNSSLHNDPESFLVKKVFFDNEIEIFKREIKKLNDAGESDNVALYISKK